MFIDLLQTNPSIAIAFIIALIMSISVHEFAHALAGYLQGDMTARDAGRLTLNPLAHLDPIGSLFMLFLPVGWGKPTPYNPYHLRNAKWGPLIVGLFGPLSNLCLTIVSGIAFVILAPNLGLDNLLVVFLLYLYVLNIMLMLFNLVPIPPLDGSQILLTMLPDRYNAFKHFLVTNGWYLLIGFIMVNYLTNGAIFEVPLNFFMGLLLGSGIS